MNSNKSIKSKKNIKICFFGSYDKSYTSNMIILQGLKENNIDVIEVNAPVPLTKLDKQEDMSWLLLLKRVFRKYKILAETIKNWKAIKQCDAIYIGFPGHFDFFFAYLVAKVLGKKLVFNPIIIFYVGFIEDQKFIKKGSILEKVIKWGEVLIYRLSDLVLADTPLQNAYFEKQLFVPKLKLRSLPLGADNKQYKYTRYTIKPKNTINVVYYGLYTPLHGVKYIIEAAHILRNKNGIKFTLVGQGNTFEENFSLAQRLKLTNIEFIHDVPVDKHPQYLEKADLFLGFLEDHPTVKRVIPNKVYQGLALGKVVVAADAPVMRSMFIHKKNVFLCKPANSKDLAKALLTLKNNPNLRVEIAENGYSLYKEKFTPKAVTKQLVSYIEGIL